MKRIKDSYFGATKLRKGREDGEFATGLHIFSPWVSAGKVSNMAGLVDSICTIIAVFQKYADRNRDGSSMKRRQMKRLLQNEFGDILEVRRF